MAVSVIAFLVALAVIATERVHRTKVALIGAAVVVLFAGNEYSQELAIESVDFNTIGLLVGMMILVPPDPADRASTTTSRSAPASSPAAGRLRGRLTLAGTTALLSAFLDNLTTILLIVPVTFLLADALDLDPIPLIIIEIIAANIGGTATLIGDPPNIIIAGATDLSFNSFIVNLAPIVLVTSARGPAAALRDLPPEAADPGGEPQGRDGARRRLRDPRRRRAQADRAVARDDPAFFAHQALHVEPATVALTGAAVGLLVTRTGSGGIAREDRVGDAVLLRRACS